MMLSILGQSGGSSKQEGVKEKRRIKSLDVCQEEYIPNPDTSEANILVGARVAQ